MDCERCELSVDVGYAGGPITTAGPSFSWIMGTLERRRTERSSTLESMRIIRDAYNGDLIIPMPEMNRAERPAVANLIVTGIDQTAERIASVMPAVDFPARRPGFDKSEELARTRNMVVRNWWDQNSMNQKMRRRARWFIGYSSAPVVIRPDFKRQIPCWEIRDPLSAYPAPTQDPDDICPPNAIFTYYKSTAWLCEQYPIQMSILMARQNQNTMANMNPQPMAAQQWELIEYVDAEVTVLGVIGPKQFGSQYVSSAYNTGVTNGGAPFMELERVPTPGGMCPAVVPQRITLDRPKGQFDDAVGMYESQARVMALEMIATERGIFPDVYLVSNPGETAQFISGPHDGRSGNVNVVKGGQVRENAVNPSQAGMSLLDRLERNVRVTSGTPAEYGGESQTNVRTGKRGDAIMAAVTSFPVQAAQETFAAALQEENRRAIAVMRHFWGPTKQSFYYQFRGANRIVDYVPDDAFEIDFNKVTYPMSGADANGMIVGIGQRIGIGMMSKRTGMELDPYCADPETEHDRVTSEAIEAAVMAGLQAQAQQGAIPITDLSRIASLVLTNKVNIYDAIAQVQKEAQQRQANSGPAGAPDGPVAPGSPEAQPGLAQPGAGAEAPTVAAPPQGLNNISQYLQMLRSGGGQ